ncbi:YugN family protein [Brevibacillus dissolubilis]|uniref:YugN family protein n=1 Tax=Brevibacillus dissolubilis TaxID=1844116 RepID=UPI001115B9D4|nr:YugN family protein [Brevibacillus dissolubilis]
MLIKDTGIGNLEGTLADLDHAFDAIGFYRGAWDYAHATYDFKIVDKGQAYYLRIQGHAIEGKLEDPDAILKLEEPFLGKHLFPHGLDYDAPMPDPVLNIAKQKLAALKEKLSSH